MSWNSNARGLSTLLSVALGLTGSSAWAQAADATIRGEIRSFTTAPKGETDGALLSDGSFVHWPPHVGERVAAIFKVGDQLEAAGRWENGPARNRRFEASCVVNVKSEERVEVGDFRPGPRPGPRGRQAETATKVGHIKELTTAPKGELDGAVLDDGTTLHWPPHLEAKFRAVALTGAEVRAVGMNETTPRGDTHFEVRSLTNLDTKQSAANDDPAPPRPPREDRRERLRDLQRQLDRMQRELDELRQAE